MRTILSLTIVYVVLIAAAMAYTSQPGNEAGGIVFGEACFSTPMLVASLVALIVGRLNARRILALFGAAYLVFSVLVFAATFTGEHDAQYQLILLVIPVVGFPGILGACLAAWVRRAG